MAIQGKAQVFLAVFGKHPGWDDHIDDLGIETRRLAEVKRVMYFECIAGNIDSGSWEAIDESARLAAFAHEFVWRTPGGLVVGRMWSSRDGKGRSKYPMVVVAQCDGVPPSFISSHVMPALAGMQEKCQGAATAAEVIEAADQTRARLREALGGAGLAGGDGESFVAAPKELASMLASAGMTGESVGLQRVLYEIDREMAPFRPIKGDGKKTSRIIDARAQHLRVPVVGAGSIETSRFWMGVIAREVDASVSMLAFVPLASAGESGFVDLIVGDPAAPQFFCVRAGVKALAPASDVPYTITPDFQARCKAIVAGWSGEAVKAPAANEAVKEPAPQPTKSTPAPVATKKKGFPWFLPVAAVVVVGGGLAAWRPWEDKKPNLTLNDAPQARPPAPPTKETRPTDTAPKESDAAALEAKRKAEEAKKAEEAEILEAERSAREARKAEEDRRAKEEADRAAAEKAAAEKAAREEAERKAKEESDRKAKEEADKAAREEADRKAKEAADKAEADRVAAEKEAADRAAAKRNAEEKAASEKAAREALEKRAREEAERVAQAAEIEKERDNLRRLFVQLDSLLRQGFAVGEKTADGQSIDAIMAKLSASAEYARFRDETPAARETADRIEALRTIPTSTDAKQLETYATGARLAEQLAAWSRLAAGGADWPRTPADLKGAGAAVATMETATNDVGGERGAMLQRRMLADAAKIWVRYAAAQTSPEALLEAESYLPAYRVKPDQVPAPIRYNLEVARLQRDAAAFKADADDAALRARLVSFVTAAADQKGPGFDAVLALLNATVSSGVDPTKSGPGARGWRSELRDGGNVVAFFPPKGRTDQAIEFARIDLEGVTSYLATTEASIGMVIDIAESGAAWPDVLAVLPPPSRADQIMGARGWEWKLTGKQPTAIEPMTGVRDWSAGWFVSSNFRAMTVTAGKELYPAGMRPPPPDLQTPMQGLSIGAAATIAGVAGCRLPTIDEWSSAASADAGGVPNRRDAAWKKVWDFSRTVNGAPDLTAGVFNRETVAPNEITAAVATDDGVVFFQGVNAGPGSRFKNLIGNVAEFVTTGVIAPSADKTDPRQFAETGRVIGASALSPGTIEPMTPVPLGPTLSRREFSDVGFRLAFSAGAAAKPVPITTPSARAAVSTLNFVSANQ